MKAKGNPQKQTENKPETDLAKLLKTQEASEKQTGNKPKNKASYVVEKSDSAKANPENCLRISKGCNIGKGEVC